MLNTKKRTMPNSLEIAKLTGLSLNIVEKMLPYSTIATVKSKEILIPFGSRVQDAFVVLEGGFVSEHLEDISGTISTINFYMPQHNPFMTVAESYFQQNPSSFQLQAFSNSTVLRFKKSVIDEFVEKDPHVSKFYYEVIINAFINQQKLRAKLLALDSRDFFVYLREKHPILFLHTPSIHLAKFMKITPQWLSRLKKEL